jgi:hypothetical protein
MSDQGKLSAVQLSVDSAQMNSARLANLKKRHVYSHLWYLPVACFVGALGQSLFPNTLGFVICSLSLIAGVSMALAKYPTCLAQAGYDWTWRDSVLAICAFVLIGSFTMLVTILMTILLPRALDWLVIGRQAISTYGVLFVGLAAYLFRAGDASEVMKAKIASGQKLLEE